MAISADDRILLNDEDVDVKANNLTDEAVKKNFYLAEILNHPANIELITNCEGCDATLAVPVMLVYTASDDGDEKRDTSILCDENCTP